MTDEKFEPCDCEHCGATIKEKPENNKCPECNKFIGLKTLGVRGRPKNTHLKEINGRVFVTEIKTTCLPCKNCSKEVQKECKGDLERGLKIEYFENKQSCLVIGYTEEEE